MKNSDKKGKKKKPTYIDDGRRIADMSSLGGGVPRLGGAPRATLREQFETYINAVKLMFLPMLAVLGIIAVAFLIVYFLL